MTKYLTPEGLGKLKKELEYLEKVRRPEIAKKLEEAISQGDLSENASYEAAKDEQGFVEGRIKELKAIISQAEVIKRRGGEIIQIGSFVKLVSDGKEEEYQLVSPEEVDVLKGKISINSPLGKEILARKKGEVITVETPRGKRKFRIKEVS